MLASRGKMLLLSACFDHAVLGPLGQIDHTWDWPHLELPSASLGFSTIEAAIARGRACLAPDATIPCDFPPHLPTHLALSALFPHG